MAASLWRHRFLVLQMARREVAGRYKGSVLGLMWSFFHPMLMLTMYTVVFSGVFNARWGQNGSGGTAGFALMIFSGMIVHALLAETLQRAPLLVVGNISYVKKIVFPLEILPAIAMGASLFHALVSLAVLLGAVWLVNGAIPATALLLPLIWAPLIVMALGFAWVLASLGVFLRDVAQTMGLLSTVLLFTSPVFYPVSAVPASLRPWMSLNPLTFAIEQTRTVLLDGAMPDGLQWAGYSGVAFIVASAGFAWFQKTRRGFANVL
jgi:lipopolysaccharide transport system permease protein